MPSHRFDCSVLILTSASLGLCAASLASPTTPPGKFGLAFWQPMPGPMPLPVFDAAAAAIGDEIVLIGGVTQTLEATPAIQRRHPIHGWLPIGSNLLETRARPSLTPLPHGRWLVLGGWSGTWGADATPRDDGETLDPLIAGSSIAITPWGESLEGHTATPLPDGRVAVVCGCTLRIFDPVRRDWTLEIELARERHQHAVALTGWMLVLAGGDEEGSIESILLSSHRPHAELWDERLPAPLRSSSAIALDERFAFVAGGIDQREGRTTDATWVLDTARRQIRALPALELARGACDVTLLAHPRGVLAVGGEWRDGAARGSADVAMLLRPLAHDGKRQWSLPANAAPRHFARRVVVCRADGSIEVLGGYRFIAPYDVAPNQQAGVVVDDSGQRLIVDADGVAD